MANSDGFRPAWWLPGAHAQTLGARLLRSRRGVRLRRERLELPDGDFVDLDWASVGGQRCRVSGRGCQGTTLPPLPPLTPDTRHPTPEAALVLVLHGLEGCAESKYALELYRRLARLRLDAVGLNFRSCSGEMNRLPRMYHSGETGDIAHVLGVLRDRFPTRPLAAVGFSLGGNVLLKYLGETGRQGRRDQPASDARPIGRSGDPPYLSAAVAISVPFNLSAGAVELERGFSKVYRAYLVRRLKNKIRAKAGILDGRVSIDRLLRARTFHEFDHRGTAPLHGFADAEDYYARSSSGQFLSDIRVPTLLLHSADDPFLPAWALPLTAVRRNPALEAVFTNRGGHVGFVGGPPWRPDFWGERTAAEWLAGRLGSLGSAVGAPHATR